MTENTGGDQRHYDELADAVERGDLTVNGQAIRGAAATEQARELIFAATDTDSVEHAAAVALGRPRLETGKRTPNPTWKIVAPHQLDTEARSAAARAGITLSEYVRRAVASQLHRD